MQAMLKDPENADWAFQLESVVTETIKCPSTMELYVIVEGATACAMPTVAATAVVAAAVCHTAVGACNRDCRVYRSCSSSCC